MCSLIVFSFCKSLCDVFSQTALWQPVAPQYISEETQVHLYVPANSSAVVKELLQKYKITHEYVAQL